eukprot:3105653-Rhodomonas_salina.1
MPARAVPKLGGRRWGPGPEEARPRTRIDRHIRHQTQATSDGTCAQDRRCRCCVCVRGVPWNFSRKLILDGARQVGTAVPSRRRRDWRRVLVIQTLRLYGTRVV